MMMEQDFEAAVSEPSVHSAPPHTPQQAYQKPKNVPEELRIFLEEHPDEWFTNEQLAERLCQ